MSETTEKTIIDSVSMMKRMASQLQKSSEQKDAQKSPLFKEIIHHLGPEKTILDIGAGVGRYAIALAKAGCQVTALEPSSEMLGYLRKNIDQNDLHQQIKIIESAWPKDLSNTYEISMAAYVIQFSKEIIPFAKAMEKVTSKRCVLVLHADPMLPFIEELWPQFRQDKPAPKMRTFRDIYPELLADGLIADVRLFTEEHGPRFATVSEATNLIADRLGLEEDPEAMQKLQTIMQERGPEIIKPRKRRSAIVSWQPR